MTSLERRAWAPFVVWLALALIAAVPYLMAELRPPPGSRFLGAFYYPDDFCQYLSFSEQASRGSFLFLNKFDPRPHPAVLVNLEWWLVGILGSLLGGRLALASRLLGLAASLALVLAFWRALGRGGLQRGGRAWGLVLVVTGGGLGWLRLALGQSGFYVPDIVGGMYPWHQMLFNTHFVVGSALLWWTLLLFLEWRRRGGSGLAWTLCGWALGLSRPYDLPVFVVVASADLVLHRGPPSRRSVASDMLALARLAPVFLYYLWLMGATSFGGWGAQAGELPLHRLEVLWAILPAAGLILAGWTKPPGTADLPLRRLAGVWVVVLLAIILLWSATPLVKSLGTSLGASALLCAALCCAPRRLPIAVVALCPTSVLLLWRAFHPAPHAFVPEDYVAAAEALSSACRSPDVVIAPSTLSLLLAARTPCHVALGHRLLTPDYRAEVAEGRRLYAEQTAPAWRLEYLLRRDAEFILLPAGREAWLGADPPYRTILRRPSLEAWQRLPPSRPPPAAPTQ